MTRSHVLIGLLGLAVAASAFDQEKQNRDADCDNGCFFGSFPGGSCTDDAACMCTQEKYRHRYFCCMAEKCDAYVLTNSTQRQFLGCEAHGVPIPEDFDTEDICGVTLSFSGVFSTAAPTASAKPDSTSSDAKATTTEESGDEDSDDSESSSSSDASAPSGTDDAESSGGEEGLATRHIPGSGVVLSGLGALAVVGFGFLL